jgi:hypothetical protein
MVEIPNGAVAGYVGQWQIPIAGSESGTWPVPSDIYAAVASELIGDGLTIVFSDPGTFLEQGSLAFGGAFTARMQVYNQSGQELDDSDLVSQIADAVAQTGGTAVSGAITDVTGGASGTNTGTIKTPAGMSSGAGSGGTSTEKKTAHQCGDPSWGFFDDPATWLQCLTTKGLTTVGLLAIGLLIGVILIFATPQGQIARAARG